MDFKTLSKAVAEQYSRLVADQKELFFVDVEKDELYDLYLKSFPAGTNPVYKTRTEHDCSCCKQFIRNTGHVVSFIDGKMSTIWDIDVGDKEPAYQVVADALSALVKSKPLAGVFRSEFKKIGSEVTHQHDAFGIKSWNHFAFELPNKYVIKNESIAEFNGRISTNKQMLERALSEISLSACETVKELIEQNSLYRGSEHLNTVLLALKMSKLHKKTPVTGNTLWQTSVAMGESCRYKNSVIGTLLTDLSSGVDLEDAVKMFESKVAPQNYKRSSALITQGMVKKAQETIAGLGLENALQRRYAVTEDLTINNVIFADRSARKLMTSVFDDLATNSSVKLPELSKVQEMTIKEFLENVVPNASTIELMLDNKHTANLMSVIAPVDKDAGNILKWDNNFSWSYNGEVADSLREKVRSAGGSVDGALRFSHTWNYDGKNQSLMDLHVFMPDSGYEVVEGKEVHNSYPAGRRIGWNRRQDTLSGGVQDVDFVDPPMDKVPVENITFPSLKRMPEGKYLFKIHNWSFRHTTTSGFKAEIEFDGQIHRYEYPNAVQHREWITLAEVTLKDGKFTIKHLMKSESASREVWGIKTNQWTPVKLLLNSPNHWDGQESGNKHWFFILEGCKNPDSARGFYNEFLKDELTPHRKVFEVLSSKLKAEYQENQLSGVGFSSTIPNSVLCKVSGKFNRVVKINF